MNPCGSVVIHEGTKVFITDLVEGWSEVRLANGNVDGKD
jgi:hypothetical protein